MSWRLGVMGASGRAGSQVLRVLPEFKEFRLEAALVAPDCSKIGELCLGANENGGREVRYSSDVELASHSCDAFIDFSTPESSLKLMRTFKGKALFIGTTGFSAAQQSEIRDISSCTPLLVAPNAAWGVSVWLKLAEKAQELLGGDFQIELLEMHHAAKKDAPSGTAFEGARRLAVNSGSKVCVFPRSPRGENEIGMASLRGGDVVGEHTFFFLGPGERLEITHRAADRAIFARGALKALCWLVRQGPGLYGMQDLIA